MPITIALPNGKHAETVIVPLLTTVRRSGSIQNVLFPSRTVVSYEMSLETEGAPLRTMTSRSSLTLKMRMLTAIGHICAPTVQTKMEQSKITTRQSDRIQLAP